MESSTTGVGLLLIERIRQAEAEVTRRLASARESAEKTVATAQAEASPQRLTLAAANLTGKKESEW